jgi:hypothetical protein
MVDLLTVQQAVLVAPEVVEEADVVAEVVAAEEEEEDEEEGPLDLLKTSKQSMAMQWRGLFQSREKKRSSRSSSGCLKCILTAMDSLEVLVTITVVSGAIRLYQGP